MNLIQFFISNGLQMRFTSDSIESKLSPSKAAALAVLLEGAHAM
jgi:hypothetical protein